MGRDVAGLRVLSEKAKPSAVSQVRVINPKISAESFGEKGSLVNEGTTEVAPNGNSHAKHDILGVKSSTPEDMNNNVKLSKVEETKSSSRDKSGLSLNTVENVQSRQKPVYVAAGDQCAGDSPTAAKTPVSGRNSIPNSNNVRSPSSSKKSQSNPPFVSRKCLDDEDNWSMASSTTASQRIARSRTTVPLAPTFRCTKRLEKRKEFYAKLEEKHQALEAEKRESEARNKEEEQAVVKQLRKTMVFKANPVPNFYYEGPPPKKELKKLPTTRAVSPKFGRRKSCGDAVSSSQDKVVNAKVLRHSLGNQNQSHKQGSSTLTSTPKKDLVHERSAKGSMKKELPKLQAKESSPAPAPAPAPVPSVLRSMTEHANADIAVQS